MADLDHAPGEGQTPLGSGTPGAFASSESQASPALARQLPDSIATGRET